MSCYANNKTSFFTAIFRSCFAGDLWNFIETYRGASLQCIAGYATPKEIERFRQKTQRCD